MLSPTTANLLNALSLIIMGLWGAVAANFASPTVFIAPAFGLIFLLLHNGLKNQNKIVSHVIPILTLLLLFALFRPFLGQEGLGKLRVGIMLITGVIALASYILFFINARKQRNS